MNYTKAKILNPTRFLTPWFRAAFVSVFQPAKGMNEGDAQKYEVTMLFDPKHVDTLAMKEAVYNCAKEKWGAKIKLSSTFDLPAGFRTPFRDGNEKPDYTGYKDMVFAAARANLKHKPQVIDENRQEIGDMDQPGFYSGCYARASISMWAYDTSGNKGVALNLNNVQKLADGEAFGGGKVDAVDEFDAAEDFSSPAISPANTDGGDYDTDF